MKQAIDVSGEIEAAAAGPFHWRICTLMAAILFFDGYDLFNAAYVAPFVRKEWALGPAQLGVLLSAGLVGLSLGSLFVGYGADRWGRRKVMLGALWLVTLASLVLATVVHTFSAFVTARVLLGVGLGMLTPLALTYINEWAPKAQANRFATATFILGFAGGGIAAGVVGYFVATQFGWRSLYWVGSLSAIVLALAYALLPESIAFLSLRGRHHEVRALLTRLNPSGRARYESAEIFTTSSEKTGAAKPSLRRILTSRTTLVIWAVGGLSSYCIHGLTNWLPTLLIAGGTSLPVAFLYGPMIMVMQILGAMSMAALADGWRRRREVMALAYAGGAVMMILFTLTHTQLPMAILVALAAFFVFGGQSVLNNYTALSYATAVRGRGVGVAIGVARVGGVLGPIAIGLLQERWSSTAPVFFVFAGALALGGAIILAGAPEQLDVGGGRAKPGGPA